MKSDNRPADDRFFQLVLDRFCATRSRQPSSEWVEEHLNLNEPKIKGRFTFNGRAYLREVIDAWGVLPPSLQGGTRFTFVGGTGVGKTISTVAGLCSRLGTYPMRALIVKPTANGPAGARSFSKTRLGKTIRATKCLAEKIPSGADRHDFSTSQMAIAGSIIDLTGANSVGQLGENRCDVVLQDEIDKYPEQKEDSKEASPIALADERMKNVIGARGYKFSTPTLPDVGIWAIYKNSDMRRRILPCPNCNPRADKPIIQVGTSTKDPKRVRQNLGKIDGWVILAWSKRFTVFEITGNEAFVKWDNQAKKDGMWDYELVEKTAHYECPHCGGKIQNTSMSWMDVNGKWISTAENPIPGEIGWQLPSLFSTSPDCAVGKLAVKFLKMKRSPEGVKGFINSDLAEPDMQQHLMVDKVGLAAKHIEVSKEWLKILTVDYHHSAPTFWWMLRAWDGSSKTHGLKYGWANQWYEIDDIQAKEGVIAQAVGVDVGFSQAEVLRSCADIKYPSRCTLDMEVQDGLPICNGWTPLKAFGGKKLYRQEDTGLFLPYRIKKNVDPYFGTDLAYSMQIEMVEFLSDIFEDMMENIRLGKTNIQWTISKDVDVEEYHEHMGGKKRVYSKTDPRIYKWQTIRPGYPDHVHACELMQLVMAIRLRVVSFDAVQVMRNKK